ncbi:MAG: gamma-glutamylcyclotransferase family protein [Candidatus Kariarchaeaceae archaeon]|jgi:gamma-glutamylcyclotransferase (GGCT)/AIG2-like uncharacterized protein YtfP
MENYELLAVYGTLKQGNHNFDVHLAPLIPLKSGYFEMQAKIYTNGRYPMLVRSNMKNQIYLEIYMISDDKLAEIDKLELPFGFHREKLFTDDLKGIWIYYYTTGVPPKEFELIDNGNFKASKVW